jgi:hypothetical protein
VCVNRHLNWLGSLFINSHPWSIKHHLWFSRLPLCKKCCDYCNIPSSTQAEGQYWTPLVFPTSDKRFSNQVSNNGLRQLCFAAPQDNHPDMIPAWLYVTLCLKPCTSISEVFWGSPVNDYLTLASLTMISAVLPSTGHWCNWNKESGIPGWIVGHISELIPYERECNSESVDSEIWPTRLTYLGVNIHGKSECSSEILGQFLTFGFDFISWWKLRLSLPVWVAEHTRMSGHFMQIRCFTIIMQCKCGTIIPYINHKHAMLNIQHC